MTSDRKKIPSEIIQQVLTEAGYRCAVPTCRNILAIDLHHIVAVKEDGGNDLSNLIALCPTCHALYHRGTITREAIYAWKGTLVALSQAFDKSAIDDLLFLSIKHSDRLSLTGDGVLKFSRLIGSGLVNYRWMRRNGPFDFYEAEVTPKGKMFIDAWTKGDREAIKNALA